MKIVIQTCKGYEEPITKLLTSIHYTQHSDNIIVVVNKCDRESIALESWVADNQQANLTVIRTKKNLWEYVSFEKVAHYIEHKLVTDEYFFFMHDTCWVGNAERFWGGLTKLHANSNLYHTPNGICFPGRNSTSHNMMLARKQFVIEFGSQFVGQTFTKEQGIRLEFSDITINNRIKGNKHWPLTSFGRRARRRPSQCPYNSAHRRIIVYYPLLDLYKAYIHVDLHDQPGARKHPEQP